MTQIPVVFQWVGRIALVNSIHATGQYGEPKPHVATQSQNEAINLQLQSRDWSILNLRNLFVVALRYDTM